MGLGYAATWLGLEPAVTAPQRRLRMVGAALLAAALLALLLVAPGLAVSTLLGLLLGAMVVRLAPADRSFLFLLFAASYGARLVAFAPLWVFFARCSSLCCKVTRPTLVTWVSARDAGRRTP